MVNVHSHKKQIHLVLVLYFHPVAQQIRIRPLVKAEEMHASGVLQHLMLQL